MTGLTPQEKYSAYVRYLLIKVDEHDWHGVSDAANDIRSLLAKNPEIVEELR